MRKPDYEELEEGIHINPDALDTELCGHIENYHLVSKGYKKTLEQRDSLKKDLKNIHADLTFEVRDTLQDAYGKITESMVAAQIEKESRHRKLVDQLSVAEAELGRWEALKQVYEQRSYALNKMVDLYIAGYFGAAPIYTAQESHRDERDKHNRKRISNASKDKLEQQTNDKTNGDGGTRKRLESMKRNQK